MACFSHLFQLVTVTKGPTKTMRPAILTKQLADRAIEMVLPSILAMAEAGVTNKAHLKIFVLDGTQPWGSDQGSWDAAFVTEYTLGNTDDWLWPYDEYAKSKSHLSWRTKLDGHMAQMLAPFVYSEGDTRHAGSVYRNGLVVGVSGVQGHFDYTIADMIAAVIRGMSMDVMKGMTSDSPDFFPVTMPSDPAA